MLNLQLAGTNQPLARRGRRINRRRIAQGHHQMGMGEVRLVQHDALAPPLHTVQRSRQLAHSAAHIGVGQQFLAVDLGFKEAESVHIGAALQQRANGDAEAQRANGQQRVLLLGGQHALGHEVQGEGQAHALHRDAHTQRFGQPCGHPIHQKLLDGGNIEKCGQQEE